MGGDNKFTVNEKFQELAQKLSDKEWWPEEVIRQVEENKDKINTTLTNPYSSYSDEKLEKSLIILRKNEHIYPREKREHTMLIQSEIARRKKGV
jgi:hypothetical protein